MAEQRETILSLLGSVNQDDSPLTPPAGTEGNSLFEYGHYPYALNVRIGSSVQDNSNGGVENIPGTTEVTEYRVWDGSAWQPSAYPSTGRCVGKRKDNVNGRVFLIWKDSGSNDRIEMYVKAERTTYKLLEWSGLMFGDFVKVAIINNWLALTDRVNAPRLIDVDTIHTLFNTLGSTNFREFHISFHKWAPTVPPIPRIYYDGSTNNYEKLKNKNYQFAYRYVYHGRLKTRWSPVSRGAPVTNLDFVNFNYYNSNLITSIEVTVQGSILDTPGSATPYNYFGHDNIKFTSAVEYIELAYKDGDRSPWRLWKRVTVIAGLDQTLHYFDGGADGRIIPNSDFNQPFDTVPLLAGTVESIDNRFVFGDCKNEPEPLIDFSVENISILIGESEWTNANAVSGFTQFSYPTRTKLLRLNSLAKFRLKARAKYKLGIQFFSHTGFKSLSYSPENWLYDIPAANHYESHAFRFTIPPSVIPPVWATSYQIVRTNAIGIDYFMIGIANKFIPVLDNASSLTSASSLPQAMKDKLAEHFENSNIVDGYQVADEISKAEKTLNKINTIRKKSLRTYLGFNSLRFKVAPEIRSSTTSGVIIANASRIYIDINNWYNAAQETASKNRPLSKMYYNFREGDRVRFTGSELVSPASFSDLKIFDEEILEFTGSGIIIKKPETLKSIPDTSSVYNNSYAIEVYTPEEIPDEESSTFYETGEWYPVLSPGTSARDFSKRDWNYTSNPAVTVSSYGPFDVFNKMPFYHGDCYSISKILYRDLSIFPVSVSISMNPDPDKTYDYWERSTGRSSVSYLDIPESKFITTQCRFSGKLVQDSFVNQINRLEDGNQFIYPAEYGRIRDLVNISNAQVESVGNVLVAVGEAETWSIYVNRTTIEDLSGRQQVSLSNRVLGSFNTLLGSHGTFNPESISTERGRFIYWDQTAGAWIRYSQDGLTEISGEFKMKNWFKDLSIVMSPSYTSKSSRVISCWDNYHERWMMFVNDHPDNIVLPETFKGYDSYRCLTFSEANIIRGWKEWLDYSADFFESLDNEVYSIKNGKVYIHDDDEDNCNRFYGTKYDSEIELIANPEFRRKKLFFSVGMISSDKWSFESIKGEWRSNNGTRQETYITLDDLTNKEDMFWSPLDRDINTVNMTEVEGKVSGDAIRSRNLRLRLRLDPAIQYLSVFNWLVLEYDSSEKTVKS